MGSFNVACSISSLSIGCGDKVRFIPLRPTSRSGREKNHVVGVNTSLIYSDCYFTPLCLPIIGTYNDYGSLDNIEENDNTKAIEKFFDMGIGDFIAEITDGCSSSEKLEYISGMFVLEDIYQKLVGFNSNEENSIASNYVTGKIAIALGFRKIPELEQVVIDPHHSGLYRKDGHPYDLKIGEYGAKLIHQKYKEYYILGGDKRYGVEIKKSWEKATRTKFCDTFPAVSDIEHLTDEEYADILKTFKAIVGVDMGYSKESRDAEDSFDLYSVESLVDAWESCTDEILGIESLRNTSIFDFQYEEYRESYNSIMLQIEEAKKTETECENVLIREIFNSKVKLLGYKVEELNECDFLNFFKKWVYFHKIYQASILEGKLKKELREYKEFYLSMYSCNRFFFPAMSGEQCGNHEASKALLEASLTFVNRKLAKKEED